MCLYLVAALVLVWVLYDVQVEFGVPSVVAKETLSARGKLAEKIEESSSDVTGFGIVSHPIVFSREKVWRAMLAFLSLSVS